MEFDDQPDTIILYNYCTIYEYNVLRKCYALSYEDLY